jgi:uncharacterized protein YndB with AHSA1/START domain
MKLLKKFITGLLVVAIILLGIGFILPSSFKVQRSVLIDAPAEKVYAHVVDLKKWQSWGVWFKRDPDMQISYSGPDRSIGMKSSWVSTKEGSGEMELIALEHNQRLIYELYFPEMDMGSTGEFQFKQQDEQTLVIWQDYGDVGNNPINHYFAVFMDNMIGPDFETGLENLKTLVENQR